MFTPQSITEELKRINDSVPALIKEFTLIEKKKTPAIELVMMEYLKLPNVPDKKRQQVQNLFDSGMFSKKQIYENPKVAKQRDDYVTREIRKSVKAGRLPTKKQLKELGLDDFKKLYD